MPKIIVSDPSYSEHPITFFLIFDQVVTLILAILKRSLYLLDSYWVTVFSQLLFAPLMSIQSIMVINDVTDMIYHDVICDDAVKMSPK
jgi:hypothetical protein